MKQLFDNVTDLDNCLTVPLNGTKGGIKHDDERMMTCLNSKVVITGWKVLGQLKVGLIVM